MADTTIYTIGHSTRSLDEFVAMLKAHGVTSLIDIRTIPKSRRYPHFAGEALGESLTDSGVSYDWMKELGALPSTSEIAVLTFWSEQVNKATSGTSTEGRSNHSFKPTPLCGAA